MDLQNYSKLVGDSSPHKKKDSKVLNDSDSSHRPNLSPKKNGLTCVEGTCQSEDLEILSDNVLDDDNVQLTSIVRTYKPIDVAKVESASLAENGEL